MCNAYVYRAALYCEPCALEIKRRLDGEPSPSRLGTTADGSRLSLMADSDAYPQGPYPDGGGESDTPQHCDACGVFLANPLTDDGRAYVRGLLEPHNAGNPDPETLAERLESSGYHVKAQWARFYGRELEAPQ